MSDIKCDIPKIKLDFPKIDLKGVDLGMENINNIFSKIAKEIQDKHDNALAMEFTKCIGELLRKNGVVPKITEYTQEFAKNNGIKTFYGVSIDELDFFSHDKVFEDKIVELKKDYKAVSELLGKYQQENEGLKQHIAELEQSRSEWADKAVEWQQKCEKLESKETEKPTKYTMVIIAKEINGQTYVTLDDFMSVVNDLQAEIGT